LPTRFDGVGGAVAVALDDAAVQGPVCDVAGFEEHFIVTQAEWIADQPHAEPLGFTVGLQPFRDTGQYRLVARIHRWGATEVGSIGELHGDDAL
jgi:hypothetical protein